MPMNPFADGNDDGLMSEINMTPLVDVMLVLLIIFLVTIPAIQHAVKLDLPHASSQRLDIKPARINVSINADGDVFWDKMAVSKSELQQKIATAAQTIPPPELHLHADRKVQYEHVANVMSYAQAGGLTKIGFVTDPRP